MGRPLWPYIMLIIDSMYYNLSNTDIGSTEQELINILEHKVYTFKIYL